MASLDRLERPLRSLRVSVTDRCNLRCSYCLPEGSQIWLPKADIATLEELASLVRVMTLVGTTRVRITGGEPLLRRGLPTLVEELADLPAIQDLSMTSNAVLLRDLASPLRSAGLGRLTISIDTLQALRYTVNTRRDSHADLLAGIRAAEEAGFTPLKLNTVVLRGTNDDELVEILRFARKRGHQARFIEYMDVGGALDWDNRLVVPQAEILQHLESEWGPIKAVATGDSAPANLYTLPDGTVFGIIASVTAPFCGACDRARLTADGKLFTCLYAADGLDLLSPLRAGATDDDLAALVDGRWRNRDDQGAQDRLQVPDRGPSAQATELRAKPHLGMHTKGG